MSEALERNDRSALAQSAGQLPDEARQIRGLRERSQSGS
jgi:hypothetical protein